MAKKLKIYSINALADLLGHDRRSLKKWLKNAPQADKDAEGNPRYTLEVVQSAIKNQLDKRKGADTAKERLTHLQCEKLEAQIAVLRKEFVRAGDVEKWGGELGANIRKVVCQMHLLAPSLSGLDVVEIEARLKEVEDEVIQQLHLLEEKVQSSKAEAADWVSNFLENTGKKG